MSKAANSKQPLKLFLPITKVDAEKRLVYGTLAAEVPDRSGEILDYATAKAAFESWSSEVHKNSDGKSYGNVRAMHGNIAAGKLTQPLLCDDETKSISSCAKVVDDAEWRKVEEGVYTGFSMGGAYEKRWKDPDNKDLMRYTPSVVEVSLVDLPCIPTATFEYIKSDGSVEMRKFQVPVTPREPTSAEVAARATDLDKAAGGDGTGWAAHIEAARAELVKSLSAAAAPVAAEKASVKKDDGDDAGGGDDAEMAAGDEMSDEDKKKKEDADKAAAAAAAAGKAAGATPQIVSDDDGEQVWLSKKDGQTFKTKKELAAHLTKLKTAAAVDTVAKPASDALAKLAEKAGVKPAGDDKAATKVVADAAVTKTAQDRLTKSIDHVSRLACLIESLSWLTASTTWEKKAEGDESTVPDALKTQVGGLAETLKMMADEEVGELIEWLDGLGEDDDSVSFFYRAAGAAPDQSAIDALTKYLEARADDLAKAKKPVAKDRMAKLISGTKAAQAEAATKRATEAATTGNDDVVAKLSATVVEKSEVIDALEKRFADMVPMIEAIAKRLEKVEAEPAPLPVRGTVRAVEKGGSDDETITPLSKAEIDRVTKAVAENPELMSKFADAAIRNAHKNPQVMVPSV